MNCLNPWLVNPEPLSETTCSGIPSVANRLRRTLIVASDEVEFTTCDLIHSNNGLSVSSFLLLGELHGVGLE